MENIVSQPCPESEAKNKHLYEAQKSIDELRFQLGIYPYDNNPEAIAMREALGVIRECLNADNLTSVKGEGPLVWSAHFAIEGINWVVAISEKSLGYICYGEDGKEGGLQWGSVKRVEYGLSFDTDLD